MDIDALTIEKQAIHSENTSWVRSSHPQSWSRLPVQNFYKGQQRKCWRWLGPGVSYLLVTPFWRRQWNSRASVANLVDWLRPEMSPKCKGCRRPAWVCDMTKSLCQATTPVNTKRLTSSAMIIFIKSWITPTCPLVILKTASKKDEWKQNFKEG